MSIPSLERGWVEICGGPRQRAAFFIDAFETTDGRYEFEKEPPKEDSFAVRLKERRVTFTPRYETTRRNIRRTFYASEIAMFIDDDSGPITRAKRHIDGGYNGLIDVSCPADDV